VIGEVLASITLARMRSHKPYAVIDGAVPKYALILRSVRTLSSAEKFSLLSSRLNKSYKTRTAIKSERIGSKRTSTSRLGKKIALDEHIRTYAEPIR
jgi:hypothetical protein